MKMKLFCDHSISNIQKGIDAFMADNPDADIKFVKQSAFGFNDGSDIGFLVITIWYV